MHRLALRATIPPFRSHTFHFRLQHRPSSALAISEDDYESVETKAIEVLKMLSGLIARLDVANAPARAADPDPDPAPPQ